MSKYIVFGWSEGLDSSVDPADKVLGTTSDLVEEFEPSPEGEGETTFGLKSEEAEVTLTGTIFKGKSFPMRVYRSYSLKNPDGGWPILALYEIPGTENV